MKNEESIKKDMRVASSMVKIPIAELSANLYKALSKVDDAGAIIYKDRKFTEKAYYLFRADDSDVDYYKRLIKARSNFEAIGQLMKESLTLVWKDADFRERNKDFIADERYSGNNPGDE